MSNMNLNPGGVIGLLAGAAVGVLRNDVNDIPGWGRNVAFWFVGGAVAGNYLWSLVFPARDSQAVGEEAASPSRADSSASAVGERAPIGPTGNPAMSPSKPSPPSNRKGCLILLVVLIASVFMIWLQFVPALPGGTVVLLKRRGGDGTVPLVEDRDNLFTLNEGSASAEVRRAELVATGRFFRVADGTTAFILPDGLVTGGTNQRRDEKGPLCYHVRILDGPHSGRNAFVPIAFVAQPTPPAPPKR